MGMIKRTGNDKEGTGVVFITLAAYVCDTLRPLIPAGYSCAAHLRYLVTPTLARAVKVERAASQDDYGNTAGRDMRGMQKINLKHGVWIDLEVYTMNVQDFNKMLWPKDADH
jgi:hypothetical protein